MNTDQILKLINAEAFEDNHNELVVTIKDVEKILRKGLEPIKKTKILLEEAALQLEYLGEKLGRTGTGEALKKRIENHLKENPSEGSIIEKHWNGKSPGTGGIKEVIEVEAGVLEMSKKVLCPTCEGLGWIEVTEHIDFFPKFKTRPCPQCKVVGSVDAITCCYKF